ncbi:TPA: glycosyltransferase, partial [Burkholderia cenocepacia]
MMLALAFLVSGLSLVIWIVLLVARGGFWRAQPARPLPPEARGEAAEAGWPAVVAV